MQDIMGGRVEKVFMSILRVNKEVSNVRPSGHCRAANHNRAAQGISWVVLLLAAMMFITCTSDPGDDPIPPISFPDKVLNLNLPDNIILRNKGASKAYNDIGVRGVIVYCADVGVYHAYERNCSYQPNEACATVNIDVSTLFMVDPCCNSMFDFNTGMPSGGVAFRPLRQYRTTFNGTELVITDQVVE
jgi:nitrite reductase/ring-hydroxylating ferredoxin subunit